MEFINDRMEKILVTGATGFIGTKIALHLANSGYHVHALYRSKEKIKQLSHPNITLFKGDILKMYSIERAVKNCDGIFHVAAIAKQWAKDKSIFHRVNHQGTLNILDCAKKFNIKRVLFTSTAGVIPPSINEIVTEKTERKIDFFFEYEKTKWLAEQSIKEYIAEGLDVVIVNPTRVYGPGLIGESNSTTKIIKSYLKNNWFFMPGNGKITANYVYVEDVVRGHLLAYQKGKIGERYILGGTNLSYLDFFKHLKSASGKKRLKLTIPTNVIILFANFSLLVSKVTNRTPLIVPGVAKKLLYNWNVSCNKAISELGYQITPVEQCFDETVQWIQKTKH